MIECTFASNADKLRFDSSETAAVTHCALWIDLPRSDVLYLAAIHEGCGAA
jgi:hypothetical protein